MTTIPQNQRLNFADFLNGELGVKKTVNTPRTENQESKEKNIERLRACFQTRNKYLESLDLGISRVWLDTPNKRIKHRRLVSFTQ